LDSSDLGISEEHLDLQAGDRLVLFTDGLTDALAPDQQPYGHERLAAFLAARSSLDPERLCAAIFEELAGYQAQAEQFDDMAVVIAGVN
jgi:sigma-B regulation protein RsbU (phosphoserine phosphatase)